MLLSCPKLSITALHGGQTQRHVDLESLVWFFAWEGGLLLLLCIALLFLVQPFLKLIYDGGSQVMKLRTNMTCQNLPAS